MKTSAKIKVRPLFFILAFLLTGNFLFTGVVANFLHKHENHQHSCSSKPADVELNTSSTDCLICGLDLAHELFFCVCEVLGFYTQTFQAISGPDTFNSFCCDLSFDGRAPPCI